MRSLAALLVLAACSGGGGSDGGSDDASGAQDAAAVDAGPLADAPAMARKTVRRQTPAAAS